MCVTDLEKIKGYIDAFRFGAPPHAGGGIGKCHLSCQSLLSAWLCKSAVSFNSLKMQTCEMSEKNILILEKELSTQKSEKISGKDIRRGNCLIIVNISFLTKEGKVLFSPPKITMIVVKGQIYH